MNTRTFPDEPLCFNFFYNLKRNTAPWWIGLCKKFFTACQCRLSSCSLFGREGAFSSPSSWAVLSLLLLNISFFDVSVMALPQWASF